MSCGTLKWTRVRFSSITVVDICPFVKEGGGVVPELHKIEDVTASSWGQESSALPPRERRDAALRRQQILAVARTLFAAQGVDQTTMQEIARTAGVGQGTLYRRYAHKGELCAALLSDSTQQLQDEVDANLTASIHEPVLQQLEWVLLRFVQFNEDNGPLLGAIDDAAYGARRTASYNNPFYTWLLDIVAGLLQRGVERGEIPPHDVACMADLVLAPLAIDLYLYQRREQHYPPERIAAAVRLLIFNGLRAR